MSFAPDFSPDRTSNILKPKAWGKAFLQLSLRASTLLSPRDFCLLSESWRHKWAAHSTMYLSNLMAGGKQVGRFFFPLSKKKHSSLRRNIPSTGWESSHRKGSGLCYFKFRNCKRNQNLISFCQWQNGRLLHLWTSRCWTLAMQSPEKSSPVLVSKMSQLFSKENNSFSGVGIKCKIYWLCQEPVILNSETST